MVWVAIYAKQEALTTTFMADLRSRSSCTSGSWGQMQKDNSNAVLYGLYFSAWMTVSCSSSVSCGGKGSVPRELSASNKNSHHTGHSESRSGAVTTKASVCSRLSKPSESHKQDRECRSCQLSAMATSSKVNQTSLHPLCGHRHLNLIRHTYSYRDTSSSNTEQEMPSPGIVS